MRQLIICICLTTLVGTTPVAADDVTATLLNSDRARDRVYVQLKEHELDYTLVSGGVLLPLPDNTTILVTQGIGITYVDFNPLTTRIKLEVAEQTDSNYDVSAFLTALAGFAKVVIPTAAEAIPASSTAGGEEPSKSLTKGKQRGQPQPKLTCPYKDLATALQELEDATKSTALTQQDIALWKAAIDGKGAVPQSVAMEISGHTTDSVFRRYAITDETQKRHALELTQALLATEPATDTLTSMPGQEHGQNTDNQKKKGLAETANPKT